MIHRSRTGSALSISVVGSICIILVGVGIIVLTQVFLGNTQLNHATESGALTIAHQAVNSPFITIAETDNMNHILYGLTDRGPATGGIPGPNNGKVDLRTYNRFVGQSFLVALNAQADGTPAALTNAALLIDRVQSGPNSIGGRLKNELAVTNQWARPNFLAAALTFANIFASPGSQLNWRPGDFQVSYLEQSANSDGASNVAFPEQPQSIVPFTDYDLGTRQALPGSASTSPAGNASYLRGYRALSFPTIGRDLYAVPTQPRMQAHLVSQIDFNNNLTQPGLPAVQIPPNTFRGGADATNTAARTLNTIAAAIVGIPDSDHIFQLSIPRGYVILDNSQQRTFQGTLPNTDNVAAFELGTGITVAASGAFSNDGTVEAYQNTSRGQRPTPNGGTRDFDAQLDGPPLGRLFRPNGTQVTSQQEAADLIPFGSPATLCTDTNSSPGGVGANATCISLATGSPVDPFDIAYHPNSTGAALTYTTDTLTAAEMTQCYTALLYGPQLQGGGPPVSFPTAPFGPTGLRVYPNGLPPVHHYPYSCIGCPGYPHQPQDPAPIGQSWSSPSRIGQVTHSGSVLELFEQTQPGSSIKVQRFLEQRLRQIKPNATQAELDAVEATPLDLGKRYFAYLDPQTNNLICTTQAPPWVNLADPAAVTPDSLHPVRVTTTYDITDAVANPFNSFNIHIRLFMTVFGQIFAEDTCEITPASGAFGLLGTIKFTEVTSTNPGAPPGTIPTPPTMADRD